MLSLDKSKILDCEAVSVTKLFSQLTETQAKAKYGIK